MQVIDVLADALHLENLIIIFDHALFRIAVGLVLIAVVGDCTVLVPDALRPIDHMEVIGFLL